MADADVPITAGSGTKIDTRTVGAGTDEHRQVVVVGDPTTAANVGAVSAAGRLSVDASGVAVPVTDNAGSLTVDAPVGTPLFARLSDGAAALVGQKTMANSLPVAVASDQSALTVAQATAASLNATVVQGNAGSDAQAWYVRSRRVTTYAAGFRQVVATANATHLAFTFVANTDKQLATIYHAASATKTVRLRKVSVVLVVGAAGNYQFELRALSATTAPATGNPAITPRQYDPADAAAEATCLALPTTAGSEAGANSPVSPTFGWNSGAAAGLTHPIIAGEELVLFDITNGSMDRKPLTMNSGVACGYAVIGRCNAAVAANFTCFMEFTEE